MPNWTIWHKELKYSFFRRNIKYRATLKGPYIFQFLGIVRLFSNFFLQGVSFQFFDVLRQIGCWKSHCWKFIDWISDLVCSLVSCLFFAADNLLNMQRVLLEIQQFSFLRLQDIFLSFWKLKVSLFFLPRKNVLVDGMKYLIFPDMIQTESLFLRFHSLWPSIF